MLLSAASFNKVDSGLMCSSCWSYLRWWSLGPCPSVSEDVGPWCVSPCNPWSWTALCKNCSYISTSDEQFQNVVVECIFWWTSEDNQCSWRLSRLSGLTSCARSGSSDENNICYTEDILIYLFSPPHFWCFHLHPSIQLIQYWMSSQEIVKKWMQCVL